MLWIDLHTEDFDPLIRELREFDMMAKDVGPLCLELASVMYSQNIDARINGLDRDGYPVQPLAESTRRRHPNRGDGEPLDPMGMDSRIVSGFEVEVVDLGPGAADVVGSWPSMDEFIGYHITGTKYMPARDPSGITPSGWAAAADVFDDFMRGLVGL